MAQIYLVADTRERSVHGSIETLFSHGQKQFRTAQINTGDYLICQRTANEPPKILACIERKSLKDFSASLKDGRYENRNKMMDLRDKTGCQLYFFVEGPAFPKPTWMIAKIPYKTISTAMINMMVRDGIHVVQTENEMGTAQRLLDFVVRFEKVDIPYVYPIVGGGADGGGNGDGDVDVPLQVLGTIEKSDSVLATEIWGKLPGISLPTANLIMKAFSVADLVCGRVSRETLAGLRTPGGRALAKTGRTSLEGLTRGDRKLETKILLGIPGVSGTMAASILDAFGGVAAMLDQEESALAEVILHQKGREVRLGKARAERIRRLFCYRPGAPPLSDQDVDELIDC